MSIAIVVPGPILRMRYCENPPRYALLCPLYRWGKHGREKWHDEGCIFLVRSRGGIDPKLSASGFHAHDILLHCLFGFMTPFTSKSMLCAQHTQTSPQGICYIIPPCQEVPGLLSLPLAFLLVFPRVSWSRSCLAYVQVRIPSVVIDKYYLINGKYKDVLAFLLKMFFPQQT